MKKSGFARKDVIGELTGKGETVKRRDDVGKHSKESLVIGETTERKRGDSEEEDFPEKDPNRRIDWNKENRITRKRLVQLT